MRYNILRNTSGCYSIAPCSDGLSDVLFDLGVRIIAHDLSFNEAADFKRFHDTEDSLLLETSYEPLNLMVTTRSKYELSKWDNPRDQREVY